MYPFLTVFVFIFLIYIIKIIFIQKFIILFLIFFKLLLCIICARILIYLIIVHNVPSLYDQPFLTII